MNASKAQEIDLSDVLASIAALSVTNSPKKIELTLTERMKTVAGVTNYLLENDPSYQRAYKHYPLLFQQTKKWIREQLQ